MRFLSLTRRYASSQQPTVYCPFPIATCHPEFSHFQYTITQIYTIYHQLIMNSISYPFIDSILRARSRAVEGKHRRAASGALFPDRPRARHPDPGASGVLQLSRAQPPAKEGCRGDVFRTIRDQSGSLDAAQSAALVQHQQAVPARPPPRACEPSGGCRPRGAGASAAALSVAPAIAMNTIPK
jgi:hypothetical protein